MKNSTDMTERACSQAIITSAVMVHSLSSGKGKMFLCAACHAFTPHVNAWKNLIGIVVQIQARG